MADSLSRTAMEGSNPVVHSQETRIGILVYDGVDLLDVAVPFELSRLGGVRGLDPLEGPAGRAAAPGRVTTPRPGLAPRGWPAEILPTSPSLDVVWVPGPARSLSPRRSKNETVVLAYPGARPRARNSSFSVCEGALILAAAGLLDGYEATTHWAFLPCFAQYPKIRVATGYPRFIVDRDRVTGGGISSGLDEAPQGHHAQPGPMRRPKQRSQVRPSSTTPSRRSSGRSGTRAGTPAATSCPI